MIRIIAIAAVLFMASGRSDAADPVKVKAPTVVTTVSGATITQRPDGVWVYVTEAKSAPAATAQPQWIGPTIYGTAPTASPTTSSCPGGKCPAPSAAPRRGFFR